MTDLDQLVKNLSHQARQALVQVWHKSITTIRLDSPPSLFALIRLGLVNANDGRATISELGMAVLRHMAADQKIDANTRCVEILSSLLDCNGEFPGLEQAFSSPNFTAEDRAAFIKSLRPALAALEKADR